jgi:hypothetical protein
VQAIFVHADYVANSAGASQNMIARGEEVKICAENLVQWIPQLKEQAQQIVAATTLAEMQAPVDSAAELMSNIRKGIDLNGNTVIDPLAGECGVTTTSESAYAMADMPLLPVNTLDTPTASPGTSVTAPVGTVIIHTPTKASGGSNANTPVPPPPTQGGGGNNNNPPGQEKTKEPRPTKSTNP